MKANHPEVGLGLICGLFGKSRQAFYDQSWYQADSELEEGFIVHLVKQQRQLWDGGAIKLYKTLKPELLAHHITMGRPRFLTLLRAYNLMLPRRKSRYVRTTDSSHPYHKWPDMTTAITVDRACQLWVSDITYLRTDNGFNYLSLVTDAYSRKIVGYHLSHKLKAQGPLIALNKAIKMLPVDGYKLIHHSDRGIQYCCHEYIGLLELHQIKVSMTQSGSPYENALAERVNGILKREFRLDQTFTSYGAAVNAVHKAIDFYNRIRPHMSCNFLTPNEAHQKTGPLAQKWRSKTKTSTTLTL